VDPNSKTCPAGFGSQDFIAPSQTFPYRIDFENDPTATAPAQRVDITDQLDPSLDASTFELTEVGFGNNVIIIPAGNQHFQTTLPMTYNGKMFNVQIELGLDAGTGQVYAHFLSIDPNTQLPPDVLTGFLPPEDGIGRGQGYFSYIILPKGGLPTGTQIRNVALVTFNANPAVATDQVNDEDPSLGTDPAKEDLNTIDSGPPASTVSPLPATTTANSFTVNMTGSDDSGGSGVGSFALYVSTDGGPFVAGPSGIPAQAGSNGTFTGSTTFNSAQGHTYRFYSVAADNVGNVEAATAAAQATITVLPQSTLTAVSGAGPYAGTATLTATLVFGPTPLAGRPVTFSVVSGGTTTSVGSATTNASGIATLGGVSLADLTAGPYPAAITASFAGDASFAATTATGDLNVNRVTPVVTWVNPADIVVGTPLGPAQLDAAASIPGMFAYTPATGTILSAGQGQTLSVTFTPTDTIDYNSVTTTATVNFLKAMPAVTWANPADLTFGTPLGPAQLDATASVPGTFVYTPPAGSVLKAGQDQALSVLFTPSDTVDYNPVTATATINVQKATPTIMWANPADIISGTPLGTAQLDAMASVPGTYAYTPAAGTVLSVGAGQTLSVSFTPADTSDYTSATATATINVMPPNQKATPAVTWASPADITYGTALDSGQLDATASFGGNPVAGAFTYTPAAGTVLNAGANQILAVTFTPSDTADYNNATASVPINVLPAHLTISVNGANKFYGQPNPPFGVTYSGFVNGDTSSSLAGTLTFSTTATPTSDVGPYDVTASGLSSNNYTITYVKGTLIIAAAAQTIQWSAPADITYGTALGATQLNATVSVVGPASAGALTYTPAAGTVLKAGIGQSLSVVAAATLDYNEATANVTINVQKAAPTLSWGNPADITSGSPLGPVQLDATASIPGTFAYAPAAGAVLPVGQGQVLSVTFTPTDTADYTTATATAIINVQKVTPTITWTNPADITYGAALGSDQLDATASFGGTAVAGTFTYSAAPGTVLNAGMSQPLTATFNPTDTTDFNGADGGVVINVTRAALMVTVKDASKSYGQPNPAFDVQYNGLVNGDTPSSLGGTLAFSTAAAAASDVGSYNVTASGLSSNNYTIKYAPGTLSITPADQTITWATPGDITYGTPLGAAPLNATVTVVGPAPAGALSYTPPAGAVLNAGNGQMLTVVAAATLDYKQASTTVLINVTPAIPVFDSLPAPAITYGTAATTLSGHLAAGALIPPGSVVITLNGVTDSAPIDPATGTFSASFPTAALGASASPYAIEYAFAATTNFAAASATTNLIVNKADQAIHWTNPADLVYGTPLGAAQLDAGVTVPGPDGTTGALSYSPAAGTVLHADAGQTLTVTAAATTNYNATTLRVTINVQKATPAITWANPADITSGTPLSAEQLNASASVAGTFAYTPAAGTVLNAGPDQTLLATFTPSDPADYNTVPATAQINVTPVSTPTPTPTVSVRSALWQTHKLSKKKTARVLVVSYSGALDQADAHDAAAYHLIAAGKDKKFGTRDDKTVAVSSAVYDPAAHTVTLTPRGTLPNQPLQLNINPAMVPDAQGRPIAGSVMLTLGKGGITLASTLRPSLSSRVSAGAIDTLLAAEWVPPTRVRGMG
jgi:hypothetical protein